jgi:hypothetical protein
MNRYQPETPRAAFGVAALALTALTIGLLVVVPAKTGAGGSDAGTLAAAKAATPAIREVAIIPGRIEVIGARQPKVAAEIAPVNPAPIGRQG